MKTGRPRKLGIWKANLLKLYRALGSDVNALMQRFNISRRTVYRYTKPGGYDVQKRLCKNSKSRSRASHSP